MRRWWRTYTSNATGAKLYVASLECNRGMVTASLTAPVTMVLCVVSGTVNEVKERWSTEEAYMQNTSIIATMRNFCEEAN